MADLATASPTYGLQRSLEPPKGDINGFLRPGMGKIRPGAIMGRRAGSRLLEPVLDASARSDLEIIGCYDGIDTIPAFTDAGPDGEALDADGLPVQVILRDGPLGRFDTGTSGNEITVDEIGLPCFAKNDNTLWLTDNGGTLSFAGIVSGIARDGKVEFATDWRIRAFWKTFAAQVASGGVGSTPAMQAVNATLVAGTVTISTGITVAANSEVVPVMIGALTGTTNLAMLGELKASRVNGAAGVGTVVIQAYGDDGALDVDAAGAIRVLIFTPQS